MGGQVLAGDRKHPAGARGRVIDRAHHTGPGQRRVVLDEQQVDHQSDHLARREVLAGRLVGQLREFADQLLEGQAHVVVVDLARMQIDAGELFGHPVEQPGLGEAVDLDVELEALKDVADGRRERLNISEQILADMIRVAHQPAHVHGRGVEEALLGRAQQERLGI